jgi:hypothetical protein
MTFKKIFVTKFEYGYKKNAEFFADFETVETNAKNLLTKRVESWSLSSSILLTCKSFCQITFLCALLSVISTDLKSA